MDLLVEHRLAMWRDIGNRTEAVIRRHGPVYRRWLLPRLRHGKFVGVIAEVQGAPVASGAILWIEDHPRPGVPDDWVPYVHSMYTDPRFRGRGLATKIVRSLVAEARRAGASRIVLHASAQGRPVYERVGFESTNEMRMWLRKLPGVIRPTDAGRPAVRSRARAGSRR